MKRTETVVAFLDRFCAGDVEGLAGLLADDLEFRGPLHRSRSREAYLDSLREAPPDKVEYEILEMTENQDSVAVFYEYKKTGGSFVIAQLCRFTGERIQSIDLVFDASSFR